MCYRMANDGPINQGNPSTFHKQCNEKGATLTVIKDDKGNVFGGYLTMSWTGNGGAKKDPGAWLFVLKCTAQIGPTKLLFEQSADYTHYDVANWGPHFHH